MAAASSGREPPAGLREPPAGLREPPARYPDPGAIAVAGGLARREPDGSVVFDLGAAPTLPGPLASLRHDEPATGTAETVQRQEADGPADAPGPSPGSELTTTMSDQAAAAPSAAAGPSAAAPGAAAPPLDELARQLFGPLTARLKAELRLDRERAGLLTDLRQ